MLHIVKPNEIDSVIGKDLGASEWMVVARRYYFCQRASAWCNRKVVEG